MGFWLLRLSVGVEGRSAANNSRDRERGGGRGQGKRNEGDLSVSTPLHRGERHDVNDQGTNIVL